MLLLRFLSWIPQAFLGGFVTLLYFAGYPFLGRDRRVIAANLNRVYGLASHSSFSRSFVGQNLRTQALIMLETIRYVFRPGDLKIEGYNDASRVLAAAANDDGVVIITAHHGSWELAGHAAAKFLGRPFYVLAKPSKSTWLTPVLNQVRERLGMSVLWTDSKSLLRDMMAVAGRKEHLGFVMDQRPEHRQSGHPSVFLGVPGTPVVQGPVLMATRKAMPVIGVYMMRTGPCRYRFYAQEILPAGHRETDEAKVAQLMADNMSAMIRLYPEQGSWNYRRWKN